MLWVLDERVAEDKKADHKILFNWTTTQLQFTGPIISMVLIAMVLG